MEPMHTSGELDKLAEALAQAQTSMPMVTKSGYNPHFKTPYCTLDDILDAIREPLSKNGLCFIQAASFCEGRVVVTSRLLHKSGQWIETQLAIKPMQDTAQGIGSALSYGKRYQAVSMLAIATGEDDDGEHAVKSPDKITHQSIQQATKVSHVAQQSQQQSTGAKVEIFDMFNIDHRSRLQATLAKRNIQGEEQEKIFKLMHDKPILITFLDEAIKKTQEEPK